jgi:hypothetical protein
MKTSGETVTGKAVSDPVVLALDISITVEHQMCIVELPTLTEEQTWTITKTLGEVRIGGGDNLTIIIITIIIIKTTYIGHLYTPRAPGLR